MARYYQYSEGAMSAYDTQVAPQAQTQQKVAEKEQDWGSGQAASELCGQSYAGLCAVNEGVVEPERGAYKILEEIAQRGIERPHILPEAEIMILAAFVLGFNSK